MCAPVDTHDSSYFGSLSRGAARSARLQRVCVFFAACLMWFFRTHHLAALPSSSSIKLGGSMASGFASAYLQVSVGCVRPRTFTGRGFGFRTPPLFEWVLYNWGRWAWGDGGGTGGPPSTPEKSHQEVV